MFDACRVRVRVRDQVLSFGRTQEKEKFALGGRLISAGGLAGWGVL